jgi:hypothetical protein
MKNRTKERIEYLMEVLKTWECLEHLSVRETDRIKSEMELLVESSVEDFKREVIRINLNKH